jgi:hypothetical protein
MQIAMKPEHVKKIQDNLDPLMKNLNQALISSNLHHFKVKSFQLAYNNSTVDPDTGGVTCSTVDPDNGGGDNSPVDTGPADPIDPDHGDGNS